MIRARAALDRFERDGRVLLLFERQVVELSVLGLRAWELASDAVAEEALTAALVAEFGSPDAGSADAAVAGLVSELTSLGLLKPAPRTGSGEDEATR